MFTILLLLTLFALLGYWFYKYGTKNEDYFKDQKIPTLKPEFLFGSTGPLMKREKGQADLIMDLYNKEPNAPIFAFLNLRKPAFFVRDPDLIKKVTIKDFDHFVDHAKFVDADQDPIFGKALVSLKGHDWKVMRTSLSPAFTGSKMRAMFELVSVCGNQLNTFLQKELKTKSFIDIEIKKFFSRFTNDVIATCAFGIEVNSQENPDNEFYKMGASIMNFSGWATRFKFLGLLLFPKLMKFMNIKFFNAKDERMFRTTLLDAIHTREKHNIVRPDLINILLNLKNGKLSNVSEKKEQSEFSAVDEHDLGKIKVKSEWSDDDLLAQCLIFFLAGFETVSTAMSFVAYELALNPDIQEKLQEEIDSISEELNGELLTYDALQKLKYLDMVVSESLRKWPPSPLTDRICTTNTTVEHNGVEIIFKKGDLLWFPFYPIQRDPKYYANPDKFDPERFSDERKHEIDAMTYLPFGVGPRNCIGSRFALMELKAAIFYILKSCNFEVCDKTIIPMVFGRKSFNMIPDGGMWIRITPRNK